MAKNRPTHSPAGNPLSFDAVEVSAVLVRLRLPTADGLVAAVRRWFGAGMLDNVVAVLGLDGTAAPPTSNSPARQARSLAYR